MKVAIIGSRKIKSLNLEKYLDFDFTEIVSGGALGVDTIAKNYAKRNNIKLTEFLPNYKIYGRVAPLKRNVLIIEYSDIVLAFWDGKSKGTKFVINACKKRNIPVKVFIEN